MFSDFDLLTFDLWLFELKIGTPFASAVFFTSFLFFLFNWLTSDSTLWNRKTVYTSKSDKFCKQVKMTYAALAVEAFHKFSRVIISVRKIELFSQHSHKYELGEALLLFPSLPFFPTLSSFPSLSFSASSLFLFLSSSPFPFSPFPSFFLMLLFLSSVFLLLFFFWAPPGAL